MTLSINIALIEPYYGGSHKLFCNTLVAHSRHRIKLVTLPARKWKWRMRGAALWFTREHLDWLGAAEPIGAILCSDMVSVADLRAMLPPHLRNVPIACYFHENQLTYPLQPGEPRDLQYGMTNITSCLAADAAWFNSEFHRRDFLAASRELLGQMPDFVPRAAIAELERKCAVLPPPIDVSAYRHPDLLPHREGAVASDQMRQDQRPPILLWCHRWEYDKNPEPFFRAVLPLDEDHVAFRLVLLGEQFNSAPTVFADAWPRLSKHVLHAGYIESRDEYLAMLRRCDIVVSSAIQENCGIAVIEAMMCGCQPLLPNRLSYPELIPEAHRSICLYNHDEDLLPALRDALRGERRLVSDQRRNLIEFLNRRLGLPDAVTRIDDALSALASETSAPTCRA